jgi:hypothetical protein
MNLYLWDTERYILVAAENVEEARLAVLKQLGEKTVEWDRTALGNHFDLATAVSHQISKNEPVLYGQGSVIIVNPQGPKPDPVKVKAPKKEEPKKEEAKQEDLF